MKLKNSLLNLILVVLTAVDVYVGYQTILLHSDQFLSGIGIHIILALSFAGCIKKLRENNDHQNANFTLVALLLALTIPVYGMLGILLLYFSTKMIRMEPIQYFETGDMDQTPLDRLIKRNSDDVIELRRDDLEIDAFKDIFKSHDPYLEENAINKLSKIVTKESVDILKNVVEQSTSDTKILAATAIIEMEDKIIAEIDTTQKSLEENPENSDAILELARLYDLYCYLDVLDSAVQRYYQDLALEQYQTFFNFQPDHFDATLEHGRILLRAGKYQKAIDMLRHASKLQPDNPNPYIWLAEAHYDLGNYDAVSSICYKLRSLQKLPLNLEPVVEVWQENTLNKSISKELIKY